MPCTWWDNGLKMLGMLGLAMWLYRSILCLEKRGDGAGQKGHSTVGGQGGTDTAGRDDDTSTHSLGSPTR